MTFEQAMAELEQIVARLESGEVALEESIAIYERGEALRRYCEDKLRQAEARIETVAVSGGVATGTRTTDPETHG
ncbi:exodeoxyribonuclease VII small subunit [Rhodothalassium salexigens]|nr:exodeoxyribonuclease VII small subunit [Rhodothalassium salexigens]MBK5921919.1 exodeoxyribonuclease VII small subunit [Rhodothalassium salexigens]